MIDGYRDEGVSTARPGATEMHTKPRSAPSVEIGAETLMRYSSLKLDQATSPSRARRWLMIALLLTLPTNSFASFARAQQPADNAEGKRQQALLALETIYSESKAYPDMTLRVRVKAKLADVLWPVKPDRARELIISAFDDTSALKDDLSKRRALRSEIISVASRHDRDLVKTLVARFETAKADEPDKPDERDSLDRSTERGGLLLDAARNLLEAGDLPAAVALARRSLSEGRSSFLLFFMSQLMEKDQAAGETLFLDALATLRRKPADPNDLLFFGMWLYFPRSIAIGNLGSRGTGPEIIGYGMNFSASQPRYPTLLVPYLETSAEVLARFRPLPSQTDSARAIELKRFALRQLLPLIEKSLPERLEVMQAELKSLGVAPDWATEPKDASGKNADPRLPDDLSTTDLVTAVKKLPGELERDTTFYQQAVYAFNRSDFERARALAAEISRSESRESLSLVIAYFRAQKEIERGELNEAEKTAAQLPGERRADVYTQLSQAWAERGDAKRADELMAWATSEAARINGHGERADAYLHLADVMMARDMTRAFEFLEAAVTDINAAEQFNPDGKALILQLRSPKGTPGTFGVGRSYSLLTVIARLAKTDLLRAINAARSLTVAEPRALAVIAACREALAARSSEKVEPSDTKRPDKPAKKAKEKKG